MFMKKWNMTKQGVFEACSTEKRESFARVWFLPRDTQQSHFSPANVENNNKRTEIVAYLWINSWRSGICALKWRFCRVTLLVDRVTFSA